MREIALADGRRPPTRDAARGHRPHASRLLRAAGRGADARTDRELRRASRQRGGATRPRLTGLTAYAGEVAAVDPRPLLGEPLPLDLLNTTWMSGDGPAGPAGRRGGRADLPRRARVRRAGRRRRPARAARDARGAAGAALRPELADGPSRRERRAGAGRTAAAARSRRRRDRGRRRGQLARAVDLRGGDGDAARDPRRPDPRLRQPGLRPVVPGHLAPRDAALVLDGGVRQSRQGDPPRPHRRSPVILT